MAAPSDTGSTPVASTKARKFLTIEGFRATLLFFIDGGVILYEKHNVNRFQTKQKGDYILTLLINGG